jgi:hypothetical protein
MIFETRSETSSRPEEASEIFRILQEIKRYKVKTMSPADAIDEGPASPEEAAP